MRLKQGIPTRVIGTCFCVEKSWRGIATYRFASNLQSSHLQWCIIIKKFVVKTSTFDSPNSLYLGIFEFIWHNSMCFGDKGIAGIYSVFQQEIVCFFPNNS